MYIALSNAHTNYSYGTFTNLNNQIITEYTLSVQINKALKPILETYGINAIIVDGSEKKPYNNSLYYKAFTINTEQVDMAIETHFNSVNPSLAKFAQGFEVLYSTHNEHSVEFAKSMVSQCKKYLPFKIRRSGTGTVERNKLYFLRSVDCPSIIIEVCFLSHYKDRLFLIHPRSIQVIAYAITDGILHFSKKRGLIVNV